MRPITSLQRRFAESKIDAAAKNLRELTESGRNLDPATKEAINAARDAISHAEALLANQPHSPR